MKTQRQSTPRIPEKAQEHKVLCPSTHKDQPDSFEHIHMKYDTPET